MEHIYCIFFSTKNHAFLLCYFIHATWQEIPQNRLSTKCDADIFLLNKYIHVHNNLEGNELYFLKFKSRFSNIKIIGQVFLFLNHKNLKEKF